MLLNLLQSLDLTEIVIASISTFGGGLVIWYRKTIAGAGKACSDVWCGLKSIPELKEDVRGIRYFVGPNGGGSLMDSAKRTEAAVAKLSDNLDLVVETMWAENDSDENVGRFHSDSEGQITYANRLYARWLSAGKSELLGFNYLNFLHPDDVERFRRQWEACRAQTRQFQIHCRLVATTGEVFGVVIIATPIPQSGPVKRWVGAIRRVGNVPTEE